MQPPTFLSTMLRDPSLNLSKKLKQWRSQLLLLTKVSWNLLLTTAIFPMPRTMNTMELQSQLQWFPNLWLLLLQLSNRFRLLQFKLLQLQWLQ